MIVAINEFDFYVNCFYQAAGLIKKIQAKGLLGDLEFLPEIYEFRNQLQRISEFNEAIKKADNIGKVGLPEFDTSRYRLKNEFELHDSWLEELFNSVDRPTRKSNDMTSYRSSFQTAAESINRIMSGVLEQANPNIPQTRDYFKNT